jgi:cell division protein FtsA
MAVADNFIVAIELGSSKVTALAGQKQPDGAIQILAYAQEPSDSFIRKGRIQNVNKMTQCISNIKEKLEKKLQKTISHVYVGIGGMGMHTVSNTVEKVFNEKTVVSKEVVDEINDCNEKASTSDQEILSTVLQHYKIGTQPTMEPVGVPAEKIEGTFLNVVTKSSISEDIKNCFRNANVNIAEMPISVLSLADAMLPEREKSSGCVLIDMGAETTSVAIYKSNILRHMAIIPLGSANVNRDLCSLQIEDAEAEDLKLTYGSAYSNYLEADHAPIKLADGRSVAYEDICGLIEARIEEIFLNIDHQIKSQNYSDKTLIGGVFLTGGGVQIKDIEKAVQTHLHFEKSKVLQKIALNTRGGSNDFNKDGSFNTVLAIIDKAETNCCGGDLGTNSPNLFEEAAKAKEEEERLAAEKAAQEEAERIAAEEAAIAKAEEEKLAAEEERKRQRRNKFTGIFKQMGRWASDLVSEEDKSER